jgi:hypothetical protein
MMAMPRQQEPGSEWMEKVAELCDQAGLPANASCYVDVSYKEYEQTVDEYLKQAPKRKRATGAIVYANPSSNWHNEKMVAIRVLNGEQMETDYAFSMELLTLLMSMRFAQYRKEHHRVVSDCQSAIDTMRPALASRKNFFKAWNQSHITLACRDSLPGPKEITIVKVKSHVENRIADESKWSSDEMGNVAADRMASEDPTDWTLKRPNLVNTVTLDAKEELFQLLPGDVWNIYKEGSTPIP